VNPAINASFNYPDPDAFFIKRIEPPPDWTGAHLVDVLNAIAPKDLPYESSSFSKEWLGVWGTVSADGGALGMKAAPDTTGSAAVLSGGEWWRDYDITAYVADFSGEFSVFARVGEDSELACTLTHGQIKIQEKKTGSATTISTVRYAPSPGGKETVDFSVSGNRARCSVDGSVASAPTSFTDPGTVGFQIWDPEEGTAHASITRLSVHPD
jgi:hypothetical protein